MGTSALVVGTAAGVAVGSLALGGELYGAGVAATRAAAAKSLVSRAKDFLGRLFGRSKPSQQNEVTKSVATQFEKKIEKQMGKRGWDKDSVNSTIENPNRTSSTIDTRWKSDGTRRDDPAIAYIREDGHYVVRNDNDGTIVQISNRNATDWKSPFE